MSDKLRLDKWLWHARFFKSRSLAAGQIKRDRFRVNGQVVAKASALIKSGDVLTFALNSDVRVIEIVALGTRRGPAIEAKTLYVDLNPPTKRNLGVSCHHPKPDKRQRRAASLLKRSSLDQHVSEQ
ncbi:MAG: RNA-binding S4 domain-containing protein [Pseudomonadota bacterium]